MFRRRKSLLANEEENLKRMEKEEFEKGDTLALILAALITFVPALILVLGLFVLIIWLIFG
ncbi:MAG: hypothetical protein GX753_01150 [Erysipelothrix sp.]|nr:hypothetical protein [Erysipelothrix sp.]